MTLKGCLWQPFFIFGMNFASRVLMFLKVRTMENKDTNYNTLLHETREKRESHRQRVLKSGIILFNNGYSSFACTVKNLHEHGAMLECESTVGIPSEFDFRMRGADGSMPARLVWRTEKRMGIVLTS